MNGKSSWRRLLIAVLFIVGYFAVTFYAMHCRLEWIYTKLVDGLPVLLAAVVTQFITQNSAERMSKPSSPA